MLGFSSSQQKKPPQQKAKDPPVLVAEKFRAAMLNETADPAMYSTLDLSACLSTPMGVIYSRGRIRKWIAFDRRVIRGCGATLDYDPEKGIVVDAESGRSVVSTYKIGSLEFQDHFTLNNVLMVRSVKRTMKRLPAKSPGEKKLTDDLLLSWTGPHFSAYCTATSTQGSRIDNRIIALPVLDFSFCQMKDVREMLEKAPRDGKEIRDKNVYLHYLAFAEAQAKAAAEQAQREKDEKERQQQGGLAGKAGFGGRAALQKRDDVIIKAKNRVGDEDHIVIDRNELTHGSGASRSLDNRIELLEDAESVIRDDKSRFVCSGLKLNNNQLENVVELELITRLIVMNSFYFLSWVDLASNNITRIPDLSPFPIVSLYLHDNKITSIDDVQNLKNMKLLQNLTLFGNPVQSDIPVKYKLPVMSLLLVPDEAAIMKQEKEIQDKKKHAGDLKKHMAEVRAATTTPGLRPRTTTPYDDDMKTKTKKSASSQQHKVNEYGISDNDEDDDDEAAANKKKIIVSPTRQQFFPDLKQQPPPPPPPPILKLKTLDHSLITPEDRKSLYSYVDMYIKKNTPKKKRYY